MRPVVHASMFLKASPNDILVVFGGDGGLVVLFVVACCFETESLFVALAGLELEIYLPLPPECWDQRFASPHLARDFSYCG